MSNRERMWPADRVARRPIATLIPYARNARAHSREQIAQIASSIREWGWTMPILVDEAGVLIAGHGRLLAAQRLGLSEVPVMIAHDWTEAHKRAYVLADNKIALNASWDEDLLAMKPVECMRRPIENNSSPRQAVYDPFCGSGTTIIAAEMAGRTCCAIEITPCYVDVAVRRWQEFTGEAATLHGDGRTFTKITAAHTQGGE